MAGDPNQKNPFSKFKRNSAGEISKMQRVFLAGRVPAFLEQAAGLRFRLHAGSRFELGCKNEPS